MSSHALTNERMNRLRLLLRCGFSGTNGPHRLVSDNRFTQCLHSDQRYYRIQLFGNNRFRCATFALLQGLAQTEYGNQTCPLGCSKLLRH